MELFSMLHSLESSNETDLVEEMEAEAEDAIEVIFNEIIQSKNFHGLDNTVFCFYEGKDDFKYYPNRIVEALYHKNIDKGVFSKGCGSKEKVLKVYTKILLDSELIDHSLFFVDRDFQKVSNLGDNIYMTPCYSIENLYGEERVLQNFLHNYCMISNRSIGEEYEDYKVIYDFYKKELEEKLTSILMINAWYCYQVNNKTDDRKPNLNQLKKLSNIRRIMKERNIEEITLGFLKEITLNYIDVTSEKLELEMDYIKEDIIKNTRGKHVEEILVDIYKIIIQECNSPTNFNVNKRPIGEQLGKDKLKTFLLGQVGTPICLKDYLNKRIL